MTWTVETHPKYYIQRTKQENADLWCLNVNASMMHPSSIYDMLLTISSQHATCELWQPLAKINIGNFQVWWYPRISNWTWNELWLRTISTIKHTPWNWIKLESEAFCWTFGELDANWTWKRFVAIWNNPKLYTQFQSHAIQLIFETKRPSLQDCEKWQTWKTLTKIGKQNHHLNDREGDISWTQSKSMQNKNSYIQNERWNKNMRDCRKIPNFETQGSMQNFMRNLN